MDNDSQESGPRHHRHQPSLGDVLGGISLFTVLWAFFGVVFVSSGISVLTDGSGAHDPQLTDPVARGITGIGIGAAVIVITLGGRVLALLGIWRSRRAELADLKADSLPDRARHAAQVLQQATTLVEELQAELTARTALLEDVRRQVAQTTERAAHMEKLSQVDAETTRVLNKYFDEALERRLHDLEHRARGREWLIGTVVALVVGIGAILVSHYVLGF